MKSKIVEIRCNTQDYFKKNLPENELSDDILRYNFANLVGLSISQYYLRNPISGILKPTQIS